MRQARRASRSAAFPVAGRDGRRRVHRQAKGGLRQFRHVGGRTWSFVPDRARSCLPCPPRGQDESRLHGRPAQTDDARGRNDRCGPTPHGFAPRWRKWLGDGATKYRLSDLIRSLPADTSAAEPCEGTQRRDGSRRSPLHDGSDGGLALGSAASASKPPPRVQPAMPLNSTAAPPWPRSSPEGPASMPASLGGRRRVSVDARPSE